MKPEISIIVPVYKAEKYLSRCIESILAQTFRDFELILIDDGSPDRSGDICDKYAQEDSRVIVVHKENGGASSARNAGLRIAKGEYIGFVDSDDYIHSRMYEILYNSAVEYSSDTVLCNFLVATEEESNNIYDLDSNINVQQISNIQALHELFLKNGITFVVVWNKLFKRDLFKELRFVEGRVDEDEFIIHRILYNSEVITYVSNNLYYYFQSKNSVMRSAYSIKRLDTVYAMKDRTDFFKAVKLQQLRYTSEKAYIDEFFWNYYKAKSELKDVDKDLKKLKKTLDKSLASIVGNPLLSWKHKAAIALFTINPILYERLLRHQQYGHELYKLDKLSVKKK